MTDVGIGSESSASSDTETNGNPLDSGAAETDSLAPIIAGSVAGVCTIFCCAAIAFVVIRGNKKQENESITAAGQQSTVSVKTDTTYGSVSALSNGNNEYDLGNIDMQKSDANYDAGNLHSFR